MTAVAYSVNGFYTTTSYAQALTWSEKFNKPIVRHYIPIPETPALDEDARRLRDKRVAFRKAQREGKA